MSDLPSWYICTCFFLTGLCFGSFLNVAALRGLSGEEFFVSRSRCPKCKNNLKWYMNIPVLSYIFLKGKCAYCKTKISIQYPIVELSVAIIFTFIYLCFGLTLKAIFLCIISFFFVLLALTDILETVIIDYHAYILTIIGLVYSLCGVGDINITQSIIGAIAGFVGFEALSRIGILFAKVRIFGEGDSLITLALGSIFGIKTLLIIVFLSFIVQSAGAIPILAINSYQNKNIKLAITYLFILFSVIFIAIVNYFNLIENEKIYITCVLVIGIFLMISLKNILSEISNKKKLFDKNDTIEEIAQKSSLHIMPFGPALIISAFI